jgi:hypothetical protein
MRGLFTSGAVAVLAAATALLTPAAAGASLHGVAGSSIQMGRFTGATQMRPRPDASCPSRTVCVFSGFNEIGSEGHIPTPEYHSTWFSFETIPGVDFDPNSVVDNSGSDIWVLQSQTGDYLCIFGGEGVNFSGGPPDMFFIQYNVNTCETYPPGL